MGGCAPHVYLKIRYFIITYKMTKGKKFYSRKKYMRFRFFKAVKNYHSTKISFCTKIDYVGNSIKIAISNQTYVPIADGLAACPDWKTYATIFNSFKLRGIKLTVSPHIQSQPFVGGSPVIGVLTNFDQNTFGDVCESNRSTIMPYTEPRKLYVSFNGSSTGWIGVERYSDLPGKIVTAISELSSSGQFTWDLVVDFYILYKTEL